MGKGGIMEEDDGCGREFLEGEELYYCGDYDYEENPKQHFCLECRLKRGEKI